MYFYLINQKSNKIRIKLINDMWTDETVSNCMMASSGICKKEGLDTQFINRIVLFVCHGMEQPSSSAGSVTFENIASGCPVEGWSWQKEI